MAVFNAYYRYVQLSHYHSDWSLLFLLICLVTQNAPNFISHGKRLNHWGCKCMHKWTLLLLVLLERLRADWEVVYLSARQSWDVWSEVMLYKGAHWEWRLPFCSKSSFSSMRSSEHQHSEYVPQLVWGVVGMGMAWKVLAEPWGCTQSHWKLQPYR